MADTGIRRGVCTGIQWSDVNFKTNVITIRHNLQYYKAKGIYTKRSKNKRVCVIDVDPEIIVLMRKLQAAQSEKHLSKFVFSREYSDKVMFPSSPNKYFISFEKKYHIVEFHPHKLRYTNVSIAIEEGADIPAVSVRAGHSNPSVIMRLYAHTTKEAVKKNGTEGSRGTQKEI